MRYYLQLFLSRFLIPFLFVTQWSFTQAQIYVGAWNPIRYPNSGVCGWAFQDDNAAGTSSDPYASIEKALTTAINNNTPNQIIYILPDAYIQNWDYDSTLTEIRDNCDGHDLDYTPIIGSSLNGLQILGTASGCQTMLEALGGSNSLQFIKIDGASNITISNVYFKGYSQAVSIDNSSNITFNNCVFESCNYGVTSLDGILIKSTSSNTNVSFNGCKFIDNTKNTNTNALTISSNSTTASIFTTVGLSNCEFVCNQKDNSGGSLMIKGRTISTAAPTTVNISGGVFANNKATSAAGRGGAIYIDNNCLVSINGTRFYKNSCQTTGVSAANDGGGAISIVSDNTGLSAAARTEVNITNALFYGNQVTGSGAGGAICLVGVSGHTNSNRPKLTITNTLFEKNKSASSGGAIYTAYGELSITNCTFKRDTALTGGAICIKQSGSVFTLVNDSFILNNATTGKDIQTDADFTMNNCLTTTANIAGPGTYNWVLMDNFNRTTNNTVGNGWTEAESAGSSGNRISVGHATITGASNQLVMNTGATIGREWCYKPQPSGMITNGITTNTAKIIWAFNMVQNRSTVGGFDAGSYGIGYILGCTNTDITLGNGYAVVLGNNTGTASVNRTPRLVKFTGGLDANANLTNVISGNTLTNAYDYLSIKVEYNPVTDEWKLFQESGSAAYPRTDPRLTSLQVGLTTTDNTYVGTSDNLANEGFIYNHSNGSAGTNYSFFDELYIQTNDGIGTGSSLAYVDASNLINSYDCANGYCALEVAGTCLSNALSNFVCTASNATGSIGGIAFFDSNGDGIYNENQPLDSIYILLLDNNNNVIARYTTDATGQYTFFGLPSGSYKVAFTKLGYFAGQTLQNQGVGTTDSDIDNTFISQTVEINTSLSNTIADDNNTQALNFQNVSAGFVLNSILPVTLISFSGEKKSCREGLLKWTTANEIAFKEFNVMESEDGINYRIIKTIPAIYSSGNQDYDIALDLINQNNYYKLKLTDLDYSFSYSNVLLLKKDCIAENSLNFSLYPQPANNILTVFFNKTTEPNLIFIIYDLQGNIIKKQNAVNTSPAQQVDISTFQPGVYLFSVNSSSGIIVEKFTKE